jgi:DNA polymerase family B, exonuclease domain
VLVNEASLESSRYLVLPPLVPVDMSPIKRALSERYGEGASPKRLRGGGFDDDDHSPPFEGDDGLFDDDFIPAVPEEEIPEEALEEVKAKIPVKDQQRWKRPDLPDDLSSTVDLNMQWIDMDVVVAGKPLEKNPNSSRKSVLGSKEGQVPVLRCYGVDESGHSVAAFLHGFTPYAYFALPARATLLDDSDAALAEIRSAIDLRLRDAARGVSQNSPAVLGVSFVKDHQSIFGYETPHTQFLKVYVALPGLLAPLKRIMEEGIKLAPISNAQDSYAPFECNVPFVLRFMVDRGITGAGWLTFPSSTYMIRAASDKETHCQVRIHSYVCRCYVRESDFFLNACCFSITD